MLPITSLLENINGGSYDDMLSKLYPGGAEKVRAAKARYIETIEAFRATFPSHEEAVVYSAPGRTEVGGNHTDHQHGCVIAAAVDLDVIGIVARNDDNIIRIQSKGFAMNVVELSNLEIVESEKGRSNALIRGIVARFHQMGYKISGLDIYTTSNVLKGSGLSSSAAFEVLVGTVLSGEFCDNEIDAVEIAKIGKYAENAYFDKASGLMDQMVSSVGSFVAIDFADMEKPIIEKVPFDFSKSGHSLCITDTKGDHTNLTPDYVAVPEEMKAVAALFGKEVLREVPEEEFYSRLTEIRGKVSDRALLRAIHFYHDNKNAQLEAQALKNGDFEQFKSIVTASGNSSFKYLQNIYSSTHPAQQGVSLGLALSEEVLGDRGACRVHGGGFAGTIQAFVPNDLTALYKEKMESLFGDGSCYILNIRQYGGMKVTD